MKHTIYKVTNKVNGKIYVGTHSTDNINDNYLGSGKGILRALKKHGASNFAKEILFIFDTKEEMFDKEREIVTENFVKDRSNYNMTIGGSAPPIYQHTEESRKRVSEQFKGITLSDEQKRKISETKKKVYHPYRGKKMTKEHNEKNRQAQLGKRHTEETKKKMSENMKGEKNPNYGRTFSKEYRAKLSKAQTGRKHSEETKRKMALARKKYYENKDNRLKQSKAMTGNKNAAKK